jgi:hypothetical protein
VAADQASSWGLRPNRSDSTPIGYCSSTNIAVAIDSAVNTWPGSAPREFTANGVSAEKNV